MVNEKLKENLRKLIDVNSPIIYINDFDFTRVDELLLNTISDANVIEWSPGERIPSKMEIKQDGGIFKDPQSVEIELFDFLHEKYTRSPKSPTYLVLKDVQDLLEDTQVKSILQLIAQRQLYDPAYNLIIFIVSAVNRIPEELKKYISYLDIPLSSDEEIEQLINEHIAINNFESFDRNDIDVLKESLKGMSKFDIDRVLDMAMSSNGTLTSKDTEMILKQKEQMVKKSGLLELVNKRYNIDDIGGLIDLKDYLNKKARVIKDLYKAQKFGVAVPKGIFLVGMPGCGKSLCAKATAKIFEVLLLKLDIGSLMGKYVGQSEENLRNALKIAEAAAPCVLWIDEIEKAFSGIGGDNDVLTRIFGYLLTWMQEKTSSVYIIATANKVQGLPPEFLRKGRFDEIFCVNLPDSTEREKIFDIHLNKLNGKEIKGIENIDRKKLSDKTKGYNGADIESIINEAVESCFIDYDSDKKKGELTTDILIDFINKTPSISKSCKEQIEGMEKIFQKNCFRDANTGKLTLKSS